MNSLRLNNLAALFLFISSCGRSHEKKANASENKFTSYLFAYFEDASGDRKNQEQLRFAVFADAINWKVLNNNDAILNSDDISQTGGIREPHILIHATSLLPSLKENGILFLITEAINQTGRAVPFGLHRLFTL